MPQRSDPSGARPEALDETGRRAFAIARHDTWDTQQGLVARERIQQGNHRGFAFALEHAIDGAIGVAEDIGCGK
jgi:hypothetical protein